METIPSRLPLLVPTRPSGRPPLALRPFGEDSQALRIERILAILRCPLAALGLVAILIYQSETSHYLLPLATRLVVVYLASAVGVVIYLSEVRALPVAPAVPVARRGYLHGCRGASLPGHLQPAIGVAHLPSAGWCLPLGSCRCAC